MGAAAGAATGAVPGADPRAWGAVARYPLRPLALAGALAALVLGLVGSAMHWVDWGPARTEGRAGVRALALARASAPAGGASWQAFWGQVYAAMDAPNAMARLSAQALGPGVSAGGLSAQGIRPAGDTLWMRHPEGFPLMPRAAQRRFQAASLSNDPAVRGERLRALTRDPDPRLRLRALLALAQTGLRDQAPRAQVLGVLDQAQQIAPPDPRWLADLHYLRAAAWSVPPADARALAELERAVQLDPYFFDAWVLLLRARLEAPRGGGQACLVHYRQVLEATRMLGALAERRLQYAELAREVRTWSAADRLGQEFASGFAAFLAADQATARGQLAQALDDAGHLPAGCAAPVREQIQQMLARLKVTP